MSTCNELIRGPIRLASNIVTYLHNYILYFEELYKVPIWYLVVPSLE